MHLHGRVFLMRAARRDPLHAVARALPGAEEAVRFPSAFVFSFLLQNVKEQAPERHSETTIPRLEGNAINITWQMCSR